MAVNNRFIQLKQQLAALPPAGQVAALTHTLQQLIPIFGTLGIRVEAYESTRCQLHLPNLPGVQNGRGGIQAGGMYTTAESAMALLVGANLTDDRTVVAKTVSIQYGRKAQGDIRVTATLTAEQMQHIQETEKGELVLECDIMDETSTVVGHCQAEWVWYPVRP